MLDILSSEISLYHKLTKDPDTYESYARYNSLQFLHMVLGDSVQEEELKLDKCVLNKFFESIVIVKGGLDLAHCKVFLNHLSATNQSKNKTLVILVDYPKAKQKNFEPLLH